MEFLSLLLNALFILGLITFGYAMPLVTAINEFKNRNFDEGFLFLSMALLPTAIILCYAK